MTFPVSRYAALTVPVGTSSVLYLCSSAKREFSIRIRVVLLRMSKLLEKSELVFESNTHNEVRVKVSDKLEILALRARTPRTTHPSKRAS